MAKQAMTKAQILTMVKGLDYNGVCPYAYMILGNGSKVADKWLDELEDRNITTEQELIENLADMGIIEK